MSDMLPPKNPILDLEKLFCCTRGGVHRLVVNSKIPLCTKGAMQLHYKRILQVFDGAKKEDNVDKLGMNLSSTLTHHTYIM